MSVNVTTTKHFFRFSYKGTAYHGWQRQANVSSVQATVEDNFRKLFGPEFLLHGCGRTDAGVHAQDYFAHGTIDRHVDDKLIYQLNRILPADILLKDIVDVHQKSNAQLDVTSRTYRYYFHTVPNPFIDDRSTYLPDAKKYNFVRLEEVVKSLCGTHDFRSFCLQPEKHRRTTCEMMACSFWTIGNGEYVVEFTADHFLRSMIRLLVHQLWAVAKGDIESKEIAILLEGNQDLDFKVLAPPQGLHLCSLNYREGIIL